MTAPAAALAGPQPHVTLRDHVLAHLRGRIGAAKVDAWFASIAVEAVEGGVARLSQPTRFLASWARAHHHDDVLAALAAADPAIRDYAMAVRSARRGTTVTTAIPEAPRPFRESPPVPVPGSAQADPARADGHLDLGRLEPNAVFASFLRGPCNALARTAADMLAEAMAAGRDRHEPLVLTGPPGVGKSHLAHAVAAAARGAGRAVAVFDAWRLLTLLAEHQRRGGAGPDPVAAIVALDGLVVDDVHLVRSAAGAALVERVLRRLLDLRRMVVVTSGEALCDLERIDPELRSRLSSGVVAPITPPAVAMRIALLERFAEEIGDPTFVVSDEIKATIAGAIGADARALRGAMPLLHVHHLSGTMPATRHEALESMRHLISAPTIVQPRIESVLQAVAKHFNVTIIDMKSSRRTAHVVRPRQIAMFLAKELTQRSLPEIGRRFGGRDHTTVLHAVRKIGALAANDARMREDLALLRMDLEGRR